MKLLGSTILAAAFGGEVRPRPDDLTGSEAKCQPDTERDSFTAGKFPDNFKERVFNKKIYSIFRPFLS